MAVLSISAFAQEVITDNTYTYGSYYETVDVETDKNGNTTSTHLITNTVTGDITKVIVCDDGNSRNIDVYINGELESKAVFDKSDCVLEVENIETESIEEFEVPTTSNDILTDANSSLFTTLALPSYPFLQSLYYSALDMWGFLYGQQTITYGPTYVVQISEGTTWSTALSIVAAVVLPGAALIGVLAALGCSHRLR